MSGMKRRFFHLLIALDQLLWVLVTLGHGHPDETLSAGVWRMELAGKWQGRVFRPLIDLLFFFDPEHCRTSFEAEMQRTQAHPVYRRPL